MYLRLLILCFPLLLTTSLLNAQHSLDGLNLSDTTSNWFDQQIGISGTELITGLDGRYRLISKRSYPFFGSGNWANGSIAYRGEYFENVNLLFDVLDHQVLLQDTEQNRIVKLNNAQITSFSIGVNKFRKLSELDDEFHHIIYTGENLEIVAKRIKRIIIKYSKEEYTETDRYFIKIANTYKEVMSVNGLAKQFVDDKKKIKVYGKNLKINLFKNASIVKLQSLGDFCDQLLSEK